MRLPRRRAFAAAALVGGLSLAVPLRAQDTLPERPREVARLFRDQAPLALVLRADFDQVFKDRDTLTEVWMPATVRWQEGDSARTLEVELTTRGHFRLQSGTCNFAPLRVRFPKEGRKGTVWAGQGKLKLVTHCHNSRKEHEQYVLLEHATYRLFNTITDSSFRARLAKMTYEFTGKSPKSLEKWGFFVEDDEDVAGRLGGVLDKGKGMRGEDLAPGMTDLVSVFEFMIGNTDWSFPYLHNIRLVSRRQDVLPLPYDFDWSGFVDAYYAKPDPRLGLRSNRERLYRGVCRPIAELQPALARFTARRDALLEVVRTQPDLEPGRRKDAEKYLVEFLDIAANPKASRDWFELRCRR